MTHEIWFWQRIVSPHMAGLAAALAARGHTVRYVAERPMSARRAAQGWTPPSTGGATLEVAPTPDAARTLAASAPPHAIHICEGLRKNGTVAAAQAEFAQSGARWYVFMETVEDYGPTGPLKRALYAQHIRRATRQGVEGWLATGHATPTWLIARGADPATVHPFAYFLPPAANVSPGGTAGQRRPPPWEALSRHPRSALPSETGSAPPDPFHFLFAGQLIARKDPLLLIEAFSHLPRDTATLNLIGTGPLADEIRNRAQGLNIDLPGQLPMDATRAAMAQADCLVLPSRHDGWGAVISEALMCGTPVICSDRCGVAGVALASRHGQTFPSGDGPALTAALQSALTSGKQTPANRAALATWARCLGADAGAAHLDHILTSRGANPHGQIRPPWDAPHSNTQATG